MMHANNLPSPRNGGPTAYNMSAESNKKTTVMQWIQTYQNHVINCCTYFAIGSHCLSSIQIVELYSLQYALYHIILAIIAFLLIVELGYIRKRATLPPGDPGFPLVGHLPSMIKRGPREIFWERTQKYGSPSVHNMMMNTTMLVTSDDDVQWWLTQERKGNAHSSIMPHVQQLIGSEAIMLESASQHRRLRRIFEPSFSPVAVKGYLDTMVQVAKAELQKWCASGDFQSSKQWSLLAMRLFFACAFGEVEEKFMEDLNRLFHKWIRGFVSLCPYPIPGNCLYEAHQAKKELAALLQGMVDDFKANNPPGSHGAENSMMGRLCYGTDDDGNTLTDSQLITNITFILFAGHDTTKGSFCAFAHYLNKFPKIRKLLIEEVQAFSEPLDVTELKNAPILNAFMAETWRLASPLGAHIIRAAKDIDFKGYKVRKGVSVALSIQGYNIMSKGRYRDPLEFRVERWLPKGHPLHDPKYFQDGINYNVMSTKYRAFNMGAHSCLGAHFAKLETRVVLTRLLQMYDIRVRKETIRKFPLLQHDNEFLVTRRETRMPIVP